MSSSRILIDKLIDLGATMRPPASKARVEEVERTLGCRFPVGLREFYGMCDGVENATEEWIWDFFSLERVVERTLQRREAQHLMIGGEAKLAYRDLICFCDVLIDAPTYDFVGNPADTGFGRFYADAGTNGWLVADSYEAFVDVFVAENDRILLRGG